MNILPAIHHPHEQNECVDSSTASKSDWLNSLHRGCLNKDTSDKYRLYGHLRALPSRKLPHPLASDEVSKKRKSRVQTGVQRSSYKQSPPIDYAEESEAELSNASLSPVFREDSTRPPATSEEVTPELFTVDEFFDYIWSDNWKEEICLRVVGGKLLNLLLTALYHLEKKQKLNSHIIRANLNNIRKDEAKEGLALNDEQLRLLSLTSSMMLQKRRTSARKIKMSQKVKKSRETKDVNKSANISTLPTVIISKPSSEVVQVGEDRNYRGGVTPVHDSLSKREHTSYRDVAALPTVIISKPSSEYVQVGEDRNDRGGVIPVHDSLSKREHTSYRDVAALPTVIISKQPSYEYVQVGEDRNYRGGVKYVHDSLSKREHTSYRDVVKTPEEGRYESMVIQLIFYEKADKSNITYQIPDKANSNMHIPGPRHVLYPAYSQAKHNMKYVRLPISEDADIKERIATVTSELDDMLKVTKNTGDGRSRDPSLLSVNTKDRFKLTKFASDTSRKSDRQLDRRDSEYVTDNIWFHSQPVTSTSSRQTPREEEKEGVERARSSSNADHLSSFLSLSDDTDTSTYKTLNLSRKEIYITGLYAPRTENKVPVQVKLQRANVSKHKVYPDKNPENSHGYTSSGVYYHPAHASLSKESIHTQTPYHSPNSRIAKTKEVTDENVDAQLWSQYIKEQEEMEMEMALNNNLTKNISERLYSPNRTSTSDNSTVRKKKAKRLYGKKVASGGDTTTQFGSRQKGKRLDEESQFPRDTPSGRQQLDMEELLDKMHVAMNVNSNSIVHLPRRKIVSKRYLYVHEFQEPSIRAPRPPSEYQKRRSYQILNHTPYAISSVTDGDSGVQNSEKNYNHFGFFPKRIFPVNYKMHDGNWSHMGLYPHDVNDQVINLSPRETAGYQCPCEECQCLREALADLKPDTKCLPPGYLHRLGKLSRNLYCQERQNYETPITVKQTEIISHFVAMDVPQVCDQLMRLIDNVMFRKEILTSSLGRTYITVTFSKERASSN